MKTLILTIGLLTATLTNFAATKPTEDHIKIEYKAQKQERITIMYSCDGINWEVYKTLTVDSGKVEIYILDRPYLENCEFQVFQQIAKF